MDVLVRFFSNYYFLAFFIAWLSSCFIKSALVAYREKRMLRLSEGFSNGGMPSSHSASVAAITIALLIKTGLSDVFYLSLVMSLIVITDAFGVRQNIGLQGETLNKLLKSFKKNPVKIVYGHTFFQVIMGIVWGSFVAVLVNFFWF